MIELEVSPGAQADAEAEQTLIDGCLTRTCIGRGCDLPAAHVSGDAKWRKLCIACNKKRVEAHRSSRQSGLCPCGNNAKARHTLCGPCIKAKPQTGENK